jgi:hypothetical protein
LRAISIATPSGMTSRNGTLASVKIPVARIEPQNNSKVVDPGVNNWT